MKNLRNALLVLCIILPSLIVPIYADSSSGLAVSTNKDSYQPGDKVTISGSVPQIIDNNPVTIIVRNPMGNVYDVGQVKLLNNLFVHDFVINDDSLGGTYTVNVKYGTSSSQLHFVLNAGFLTTIPIYDSEIKIRTNSTNPIKYGDVSVSTVDKTINISMDTTDITGNSAYQQYQIPKQVIDTPGGNIIVKIDDKQTLCPQSETDTTRILDCIIPANSKEIEFVGTLVIPEFGPLVGLVILASISSVIVLSRITKTYF
ncbi:MAG: hypothetical protein KGH76_04165 [Thaumarchaeota archaeon]|nr:hypothetical protein [Nitrososphaerota archaeon]